MIYSALKIGFLGTNTEISNYPKIEEIEKEEIEEIKKVKTAAKDLATAYDKFEDELSDSEGEEDSSGETVDSSSDEDEGKEEKEYLFEVSKAEYVGSGTFKNDLLDITIQVVEDPGRRNLGTVGTAQFSWDPILETLHYNFTHLLQSERQKQRKKYAIEEDPFTFDKNAAYAAARYNAEHEMGFKRKPNMYEEYDKKYNYVKTTRGNRIAI
tara:strand:- start:29 stop:661 length:633 start_codon:yes stop_codon:yes gene_type:complete